VAVPVLAGVPVGVLAAVLAGVPDGDDCEVCGEGDGEVVFFGALLTLAGGDDPVGGSLAGAESLADELTEGEGDGDGDGDSDGEWDGDGVGVGVAEEGSAWHTVSVFDVVAVFATGAACAVPSTPKVRKLPLSKVTAATLTCAKRIRIACPRCSSGLPCALS
jgi:hypothetical protein